MDDAVDSGPPVWERKKPEKNVTTVRGSSKCHCFSDNFIEYYRRFIPTTAIDSTMCFVSEDGKPCATPAAGGAHVMSGGTVMICS